MTTSPTNLIIMIAALPRANKTAPGQGGYRLRCARLIRANKTAPNQGGMRRTNGDRKDQLRKRKFEAKNAWKLKSLKLELF